MTTTPLDNWEAEQLEKSLSQRVNGGFGAFWVAGSRPVEPPPVRPIALTGGIPDADALPIDQLVEVSNRVLRESGPEALRYGGHQGSLALREWLAEHTSDREGLELTANNFTLTNGISGGLVNVAETFLDEGDVGLAESPTFPGGVGAFQNCLCEVGGVPMDEHGILPDELEAAIKRHEDDGKRVKVLYTVPNFQNPTGYSMALDRRHAVVDICQRHEVLIAEDDAYGDIRFEGERLPSLFALARGNGVVFLGSFSKTMATGLRVGWTLAAEPVIDALLQTRFDLGGSPWMHKVIHEFASAGLLEKHLDTVNEIYRRKRDAMLSALDERCSRYATWNRPEGGYFLWLTLAETVDPKALADAARRHGVAYVGGYAFHRDGGGHNAVRLAYSFVKEDEIPEAITRLGRALEEAAEGATA